MPPGTLKVPPGIQTVSHQVSDGLLTLYLIMIFTLGKIIQFYVGF